jgi:hypothetical protein
VNRNFPMAVASLRRRSRIPSIGMNSNKYGRTLASVYVGDQMLNAELVRQGYAQVATFPSNVKYAERFRELQREAREAGHGLWGPQRGHGETAHKLVPRLCRCVIIIGAWRPASLDARSCRIAPPSMCEWIGRPHETPEAQIAPDEEETP